ncbi:hypothetical protein ABTE89_18640, partial [Acinetobacter baumannii]
AALGGLDILQVAYQAGGAINRSVTYGVDAGNDQRSIEGGQVGRREGLTSLAEAVLAPTDQHTQLP